MEIYGQQCVNLHIRPNITKYRAAQSLCLESFLAHVFDTFAIIYLEI